MTNKVFSKTLVARLPKHVADVKTDLCAGMLLSTWALALFIMFSLSSCLLQLLSNKVAQGSV